MIIVKKAGYLVFKESKFQANKNSSVFLFPDEQNKSSETLIKILKQGYEHQ